MVGAALLADRNAHTRAVMDDPGKHACDETLASFLASAYLVTDTRGLASHVNLNILEGQPPIAEEGVQKLVE